MTEFKYGSNNYHKKLSTVDKASIGTTNVTAVDENCRRPHSRLKKSFSECEYYEMDIGNAGNTGSSGVGNSVVVNFNLSPSRRKCRIGNEELHHRYHHCPRQSTFNDSCAGNNNNDISFIDVSKAQYNYDTSKSQYLLAQQQKLKEYKNDPNYLTTVNSDNYSSESSTETKGILKKSTTASSTTTTTTSDSNASNNNTKCLLKRNKGLSTLSLCSCDADTEVSELKKILSWLNRIRRKRRK